MTQQAESIRGGFTLIWDLEPASCDWEEETTVVCPAASLGVTEFFNSYVATEGNK